MNLKKILYPFVGVMEIAATMLRQQQAEIEALKAAKIRAYNNGVEDGRKPDTNNKPVVWMSEVEGGTMYTNYEYPESIPLYTHEYERPHNTVLVPCDKLAEMQAEIEALRKFKAEIDAENKRLFEAVQKANAMWDRATGVKNEQ